MFEPSTLPRASDARPLNIATRLDANSGSDVPPATSVMAIVDLGTPHANAMLDALSIKRSPPHIRPPSPSIIHTGIRHRGIGLLASSSTSAVAGVDSCVFLSARMVNTTITIYPNSSKHPSIRDMSLFVSVVATRASVAAMHIGISRRMLVLVNMMGEKSAHTPSMASTLNMFDPTIFPIAIALSPFSAEIKLTVSSGIDVPIATIVSPTINSGT